MEDDSNALLGNISALLNGSPISGFNPIEYDDPIDDDELEQLKNNKVMPKVGKEVSQGKSLLDIDEDDIPEPTKRKPGRPKKPITSAPIEDDNNNDDDGDDDTVTSNEVTPDNLKPAEPETDDNTEAQYTSMMYEAVMEQLGITLGEDEERPVDVEGLVTKLAELVEKSSVPAFASDEVAEIDEFVRNGGRVEDYLTIASQGDLDNIDLTNENNQRAIVRDLLVRQGFSKEQIIKKINKYETADLLEDEAADALEKLKEIANNEKETLLTKQKNLQLEQKKQQEAFITDVASAVKNLDTIHGIKIPTKDKEELLKNILKLDANGESAYVKKYREDPVKHLITSAYFVMKGDALLKSAKAEAETTALQRLKKSLNSTGVTGSQRIKPNTNNTTFSNTITKIFGKS
jgi:hypothetical protein